MSATSHVDYKHWNSTRRTIGSLMLGYQKEEAQNEHDLGGTGKEEGYFPTTCYLPGTLVCASHT